MKRSVLMASLMLIAAACTKTPTARISGTVDSLKDSCIVLQRLDINVLQPVDTIVPDAEGKFDCKVSLPEDTPAFYYLFDGESQIASVVLLPKDDVRISVDKFGTYTVEGSVESELLRDIDEEFYNARTEMEYLADMAMKAPTQAQVDEINSRLSRAYVDYKRTALNHIMSNQKSITSAVVAFQKFNDELPVFNELTDVIVFRQLHDSLQTVYPKSRYVVALMDEINRRDKVFKFSQKIEQIESVSFPELNLPDIDAKPRILSELKGKVIVLSFWSVSQAEHKMFNNELVEIYDKYHESGLEVYQVSFDIDKPTWAAAVRNQNLPWISVNDGYGVASPAAAAYNISQLPTMFIIDRSGDIVARDVYDPATLESIVKKCL